MVIDITLYDSFRQKYSIHSVYYDNGESAIKNYNYALIYKI